MAEELVENFALRNRVRELRTRLGLRQLDVAEATGVTRQTIIAIEQEKLNPSMALGLKIARVLREPVDYVFYLGRLAGPPPKAAALPAQPKKAQVRSKRKEPPAPPAPAVVAEPPRAVEPEPELEPVEQANVVQTIPQVDAQETDAPPPLEKGKGKRKEEPESPQSVFDFR